LNILVLSFYYHPDLGAGSFRATALVNELKRSVPDGSHIHVLTTLPNRYKSYPVDAPQEEIGSNYTINRIMLPSHKSGMIDQARAFAVFSREVIRQVKSRKYDLVFATASRLMPAVLGAWIARKKKATLYLDIRDIFVDTIKDVFPKYLALLTGPLFSLLERWAVNRATKVNLVSKGFAGYFNDRYPGKSFTYFTNGIDNEFIEACSSICNTDTASPATVNVLCAGNIGEGQGLHSIIPEIAKRMEGRISFKVIGDGGRKDALRTALLKAQTKNVELLPPVNRTQLIKEYLDADVLFLHLNDYDAFKKVLPSKLFEYAAMGKPVWAGIAGHSASFVNTEINNAAVFSPCDDEAAEKAFNRLRIKDEPRQKFIDKYSRSNIMKKMAEDILSLGYN